MRKKCFSKTILVIKFLKEKWCQKDSKFFLITIYKNIYNNSFYIIKTNKTKRKQYKKELIFKKVISL